MITFSLFSKKQFLAIAVLVSGFVLLFGHVFVSAQELNGSGTKSVTKPNIIYIMLDDAGYEDFLTRDLIRPNIDKFAKESILFDNFYMTPMCSPTRVSVLSGNYPAHYGMHWVFGPNSEFRGVSTEETSLVDALNDAGYKTAHIGKWHGGTSDKGFDLWDHNYNYIAKTPAVMAQGYFDPIMTFNKKVKKQYVGEHVADVNGDLVVEYMHNRMAKAPDKPFFINVWFNAPHEPFTPSVRWREKYDVDDPYGDYKALFSQADENVGKIVDAVDSDQRLRENTIIIVTSDNGSDKGTRDVNGEFRGLKASVYEGGIRLPFFVRMPSEHKKYTNSTILSVKDIMPTLIDLAGGVIPEGIDGKSFAHLLRNSTEDEDVSRRDVPIF